MTITCVPTIQEKTTALEKPIPFAKKDVCLFIGAIVHKMEQIPYPLSNDKDKAEMRQLSAIFHALKNHHHAKMKFKLRDTAAALKIASALRMYNSDRESGDLRLHPSLATSLLVTDLDTLAHPSSVAIDNLIYDLESAANFALEQTA